MIAALLEKLFSLSVMVSPWLQLLPSIHTAFTRSLYMYAAIYIYTLLPLLVVLDVAALLMISGDNLPERIIINKSTGDGTPSSNCIGFSLRRLLPIL